MTEEEKANTVCSQAARAGVLTVQEKAWTDMLPILL